MSLIDPAIQNYLNDRKVSKTKKVLNSSKSNFEKNELDQTITDEFMLQNWLPDAAKRARQLSIVSHCGKFSHPRAKTSAVLTQGHSQPDGFLRTGNSSADLDVIGNAAALDVYKFLILPLQDGQTLLAHLEQDTDYIKQQFSLSHKPYAELREEFLAIKQAPIEPKTSEKIKQVYFPVENGYHLLSIMTPSGLVFKLKNKINNLLFSEQTKQARESRRNQESHETGFDELYDLTIIGFGGTQPQNISELNSKNLGTAYLLPSMPPKIEAHMVEPPHSDFFNNCLQLKNFKASFQTFHKTLKFRAQKTPHSHELINAIIEQVLDKAFQIQQLPAGWSVNSRISQSQKIWLDTAYLERREQTSQWLDNILNDFIQWFAKAYTKSLSKNQVGLFEDAEFHHVKKTLREYQEFF